MEETSSWEGLLFLIPTFIVIGGGYGWMISKGTKMLTIKQSRPYGWAIVTIATLFLMSTLGPVSIGIGVLILKAPILESFAAGVCLSVLITTFIVGLRNLRKVS